MPIDQSLVAEVYRGLLKREPESQAVTESHARSSDSVESLIRVIANSGEFRRNAGLHHYLNAVNGLLGTATADIEVDADGFQMDLLIHRTIQGWMSLGEADPYWSVLTDEAYKLSNLNEEKKKEFFATGKYSASLIEKFEQRANFNLNRDTCHELGCGVGRITYYLSKMFKKVIASDISEGNLRVCEEYLSSLGVNNVEYVLIKSLSDYERLPEHDFMFSLIVLQHNTPPIQKFLIDKLTAKIKIGGGCLFQTPASLPGYRFKIDDYLNKRSSDMEMHAIPMHEVLSVLQRNKLTVKEVLADGWTGQPGSYTYFAVKELGSDSI
ncbi:class I SAM-dependent methyltransferase [Lacisediminimonas profundi]|uniref:class I SAM-dependent methyltransferase n=1 Tax=Lacisediminimonas profundi TaxID=2603856 RepID=UPI00124AEEDE|nr:class I SAM-dependent methyltransferase [Lacisediminimonas profundi]